MAVYYATRRGDDSSLERMHLLYLNVPKCVRTHDRNALIQIACAYDELQALLNKYHVADD
jgi:hypothetical protein